MYQDKWRGTLDDVERLAEPSNPEEGARASPALGSGLQPLDQLAQGLTAMTQPVFCGRRQVG